MYTDNFWKLTKSAREEELDSRMKNNAILEVAFTTHKQIGTDQKEIDQILKELKQNNYNLEFSQTVITSHDSPYIARYLARGLVTSYCYEKGIDPSTISFNLIDIRKWGEKVSKRFLWIPIEKKSIITQTSLVYFEP